MGPLRPREIVESVDVDQPVVALDDDVGRTTLEQIEQAFPEGITLDRTRTVFQQAHHLNMLTDRLDRGGAIFASSGELMRDLAATYEYEPRVR